MNENHFKNSQHLEFESEFTNEYPILDLRNQLSVPQNNLNATTAFNTVEAEPEFTEQPNHLAQDLEINRQPPWADQQFYDEPFQHMTPATEYHMIDEDAQLKHPNHGTKLAILAVAGCLTIGVFLIGYVLFSSPNKPSGNANESLLSPNASLENTDDVFSSDDSVSPFASDSPIPETTSTTASTTTSTTEQQESSTSTTTKRSTTTLRPTTTKPSTSLSTTTEEPTTSRPSSSSSSSSSTPPLPKQP